VDVEQSICLTEGCYVRFKVLRAVNVNITVFCDETESGRSV
jgi:hypothetical protein